MKKNKFKTVFEKGKYFYSKYVIVYAQKNHTEENDIGIIVSRKIGNSVVRHRYTRIIREICRLNLSKYVKGYDVILISKKSIIDKEYREIELDLIKLFEYINRHEKDYVETN